MAEEILNTESEEVIEEKATEEVVENKNEVNDEKPILEGEMLRYQANKKSYWLGMLGVVVTLIYLFVTLNCFTNFTGILMGKILGNIILFLAGFLCCEKMKTYDLKWSYVSIAFGILAVIRAFIFPIFIISGKVIRNQPRVGLGIFLIICMFITAALYIVAGLISIKKTKVLNDYLISINEPRNI